jgi:hypothetical protein
MSFLADELRLWWRALPKLLRFLAVNCVIGITAGWLLLGMLIVTNVGGLRNLIADSPNPVVPLVLLAAGFGITFGSAAMGSAVMMLPYNDDEP